MPGNITIKMYASAAGDDAANFDVPDDGLIRSASLILSGVTADAGAAFIQAEIGFASTSSFSSNDIRTLMVQGFIQVTDHTAAPSTGMSVGSKEFMMDFPNGMRVFAGERIHLHVGLSGMTFGSARALIVFEFKKFTARRR